jgi:hypothetical protein
VKKFENTISLLPITSEQEGAARLKVCDMAPDAEAAKEVLDALGILPTPPVKDQREATPKSEGRCSRGHLREKHEVVKSGIKRCALCHEANQKKNNAKRTANGGKAKRKTHCLNNHLWTPETTKLKSNGHRICTICFNNALQKTRLDI